MTSTMIASLLLEEILERITSEITLSALNPDANQFFPMAMRNRKLQRCSPVFLGAITT